MHSHSPSERSVGYVFLMRARVATYYPTHPFRTVSLGSSMNRGDPPLLWANLTSERSAFLTTTPQHAQPPPAEDSHQRRKDDSRQHDCRLWVVEGLRGDDSVSYCLHQHPDGATRA